METITHDKQFTISDGDTMTVDNLQYFLSQHSSLCTGRYKKLKDAYQGDYEILKLPPKPNNKPDNRIVVNFAKYLVDTFNGFFIGTPIQTSSKDAAVNDYIQYINKYNDQEDNDAELSRTASIYGKAYELYFVDDSGEIGITYMSPIDGFMVYDDTVLERPRYFVTYYREQAKGRTNIIKGTVYDQTTAYTFTNDNGLHFTGEFLHGFRDIPASELLENEDRMGAFESVYSIINAYNKAVSEKLNDIDYFANAILAIKGVELSEDQVSFMNQKRVLNMFGNDLEDVNAWYIAKPDSDQTQEHFIDRMQRLIFQISMIADINDQDFGTASGIALKYKLLSMMNLAKTKERKFTSLLNRRYKIIFSNPTNKMNPANWMNIDYKYTQNIPANLLEEAQIAGALAGIVSKDTQLKTLSVVTDIQEEKAALEKETDRLLYMTDYPTERDVNAES